MSAAEINEIISFVGIGLLILAMLFIQLGRRKLTGFLGFLSTFIAYVFLIVGALIVIYIVIGGPTGG